MRSLVALVLLGGTATADPRSCGERLEAAKAALIAKGFRPTTDGDTQKWLVVTSDADEASMGLTMGGADSAHTSYWVTIEHKSGDKPADWHGHKKALCCDDNHEASDHIIRFTWEKTSKRGATAVIELDRFGDDLGGTQHEADLFMAEARRAAEACLRIMWERP